MPLRKHFILLDTRRRYVDEMAWMRLRNRMGGAFLPVRPLDADVNQYLTTKQMYADARVEVPPMIRPRMPSWRKEIPALATALYDAGQSVDLRIFHSRKHARPSRSKLRAVRSAA